MSSLTEELARVEGDLEAALSEKIRIQAQIEGLQAQRDSLRRSLTTSSEPGPASIDISSMTKSEAIVAILKASPSPMTLGDLADAMTSAGKLSNANGVSVYINGLLDKVGGTGQVKRVARGQYVAAEASTK